MSSEEIGTENDEFLLIRKGIVPKESVKVGCFRPQDRTQPQRQSEVRPIVPLAGFRFKTRKAARISRLLTSSAAAGSKPAVIEFGQVLRVEAPGSLDHFTVLNQQQSR